MRDPDPSSFSLRHIQASFAAGYREAVQKFSDLPCVSVYDGRGQVRRSTFKEFDRDVGAALARVRPLSTDLVVTAAANSYEHLVFIAALLLASKTICLINPEEGEKRIHDKLEALREPYSFFFDVKRPELGKLGGQPLVFDGLAAVDGERGSFAFGSRPMILCFTSGSTGHSKIVEQMESGVLANVDVLIEHHRLGPGVNVATPLPVFHVNALEFSFFCCLFSGASLTLLERFVPSVLLAAMAQEQTQILSLVPPMLRGLADEYERELKLYELPKWQYTVTAAAPLSVRSLREAVSRLRRPIVQGYGLSEAVNFSCIMPLDLPEDQHRYWCENFPWPSIGPALRCNEIRIMDEDGAELQDGQIGEICIRGPNVMRGYRGEASEGIFRAGWLRSGDLGLFHRDSSGQKFFFVTGRKKEIVKRYGSTISLQELDEIVARFSPPGFDAIAVGFQNLWSGEDVGLVVKSLKPRDLEFEARFTAFLEGEIPAYMRPKIIVLSSLALRTPSGKPCRWRFQSLFNEFSEQTLGQSPRFFDR